MVKTLVNMKAENEALRKEVKSLKKKLDRYEPGEDVVWYAIFTGGSLVGICPKDMASSKKKIKELGEYVGYDDIDVSPIDAYH